jgi:prepilin-type N-terminal cleavage/methylation domain-containing protein/prepilin-type processing-associated H-X9-DG protein
MVKSFPPLGKHAFTLIEFLVVVAAIGILAALLVPSLNSALESAKATKDLSNLRQIGALMQSYLNDKDQILPASPTWPGTSPAPVLYPKYVATTKVFQSPFDKRTPSEASDGSAPVSYSINHNLYDPTVGVSGNLLKVVSPASTFFMAPIFAGNPATASSWNGTTAGNAPDLPVGAPAETRGTHRGGQKINVLFCDWHTETLTFAGTDGAFQDATSNPLGLKHWDPRN